MSQDPFALLLEEESDDQHEEEKDIPCLHIENDEIEITIEDSLFADDEYTEKIRILLKYLQKDKDVNSNKYKRFDLSIDLTEKELEIQENNPLYGLKYVLELSKKYMTSLSIYITAYRDKRQAPFNNRPPPLDNDIILSIFETIRESICKYRLHDINLQWIPVNSYNYNQFTNGIIDILNIKPNEIRQRQILMHILFSSEWLKCLSNYNAYEKGLIDAIGDCKICKDLTLHFDKSAAWLTFDKNSLKSIVLMFNSIGNNQYIESLSIFGIPFAIGHGVVDALAKCLHNKTLPVGKEDFSLSLSFDQFDVINNINNKKDDLYLLLDALYENDNICLNELCLYRNGANSNSNWDMNSINLICDLMESDQHRIQNLVLEGDFVSKYSFGMYKVVGFDKLVNCVINKQQQLKRINIGTILDDGDSDIYINYVIQLIEECNIWLSSITIKYENFTSNFTEIIEAFFNRLQIVYKSIKCIRKELFAIFEMVDVVDLIVDFCKIECFEIFIVDHGDADIQKTDLNTERAEFRNCLYDFFAKIQFEVTSNITKKRKEFHQFTQEISESTVGIWTHPFKSPEQCVSVIL